MIQTIDNFSRESSCLR